MRAIDILLIEDNPGDVELTKEALLDSGRINNLLNIIMDGEEALDYLFKRGLHTSATTPDIILLDLNLPKVDGREILREIKQESDLSRIPVIILSSSEAASDIQETYDLHANCFVTKPVNLDEFLRVVQMIEHFWIEIVTLPEKN